MLSHLVSLALLAASPTIAGPAPVYFAGETAGVGDPNPYYENGVYSVFYLKNEGRHPWWVTQSADLSAWSRPLEVVPVGQPDAPDDWTGSGSVIADPAGGYRLYYTGHDPEGRPKEVVMGARAPSLAGPWRKTPETTFAGPPDYDPSDFRDPFVLWNAEAKAYWMLLATRHESKAAIGLYTSPDLARWTAAPPLYAEASPLNLEVPDLFPEGGDWFLLYSDQRQARQVRYLTATHGAGGYAYGPYDALDGRGFYAGKSAGTGESRLLFGWVAHKSQRQDAMDFVWGGDLVAHAVRRTGPGTLAVSLPGDIARQFDTERATLSPTALEIGAADRALRVRADLRVKPGQRLGVAFNETASGRASTIVLDTAKGEAAFLYDGDPAHAPRVAFPPDADGRYTFDLVVDPRLGLGVIYINDFRALSFRYYRVGETTLSLFADGGFAALTGSVKVRGEAR
ncbi:beta-fructosidase, levanase/invertase [Caulobacter sp. AP07]|uniref:beta-fructosidase, levanase/invertase n=1 Tax=Caulobacter sp. AP07 TaxID=1144304 RepID=UPI00027210C6|nr:beta-fructosidase, levanase/invertase [Caulobacter sp. AP07]EJL36950.1 beta-fructosidase, levanase/invertase [Caulobacter sp. AP07]